MRSFADSDHRRRDVPHEGRTANRPMSRRERSELCSRRHLSKLRHSPARLCSCRASSPPSTLKRSRASDKGPTSWGRKYRPAKFFSGFRLSGRSETHNRHCSWLDWSTIVRPTRKLSSCRLGPHIRVPPRSINDRSCRSCEKSMQDSFLRRSRKHR
jgi:hypothetical protein